MKYAVVLNAPAGSGKDTVAEHFSEHHHKEFKASLFDIAKSVAQISDKRWNELYSRELKEQPTDELFGRSPREHMIHTSEKLIKPVYGNDYFGKALCRSLEDGINIISDGGFKDEIQFLIDELGSENVLIIQIYRDGCSFDNDSRNYVDDVSCDVIGLNNNSTLNNLFNTIDNIIKWYFV